MKRLPFWWRLPPPVFLSQLPPPLLSVCVWCVTIIIILFLFFLSFFSSVGESLLCWSSFLVLPNGFSIFFPILCVFVRAFICVYLCHSLSSRLSVIWRSCLVLSRVFTFFHGHDWWERIRRWERGSGDGQETVRRKRKRIKWEHTLTSFSVLHHWHTWADERKKNNSKHRPLIKFLIFITFDLMIVTSLDSLFLTDPINPHPPWWMSRIKGNGKKETDEMFWSVR